MRNFSNDKHQDHKFASRRGFLRNTSHIIGAGAAMAVGGRSIHGLSAELKPSAADRHPRLPREVWIATISQNRLEAANHQQMTKALLRRMAETLPLAPDVICLPEIAPFTNLTSEHPSIDAVAEIPIGEISQPFAEFARTNHCHVVCPTYTKEKSRIYNAAVFINRQGDIAGEYRKMHPTISEMDKGVSPGPAKPSVIDLDFGKVGAQICFDIQWPEGWLALERAGAEVVFWPSAFAGGLMVNAKARQHKYTVVSSTNKGTTKICDILGQELTRTDHWKPWCCTSINLEKVLLHTWPYVRRFPEIQAKYGRKIRIVTHAEEECSVIESLSPDVRVADIMQEYELLTHRQHIDAADRRQQESR